MLEGLEAKCLGRLTLRMLASFKPVGLRCGFGAVKAPIQMLVGFVSDLETESKLSTTDPLALAPMKNAAKREM